MCRAHGHPGMFTDRLWISARHHVRFYPNAVTLSPGVTAAETVAGRDTSGSYSVKDSFARLDLAGQGLEPLFEAEWIARLPGPAPATQDDLCWSAVTGDAELARWETVWAQGAAPDGRLFRPALLADPHCTVLACHREGSLVAGAIAYTSGPVTGISNVFGAGIDVDRLWASVLPAGAALRPDLPLVGYERGADLAAARQAGCRVLGPLRVWARGLA